MAVTAPSDLVVTAISSERIDISWVNNDIYAWIRVWRGKGNTQIAAEADLSPLKRIPGSWEHLEDSGLEAEEWYAYKIFGFVVHPYEESAFSNTDAKETFAPLYAPSDVVATAISNIEIELTFKDNCEDEILHRVERRLDAGAWALVVELEPNREFFRDGGLFLDAGGYVDCVPTDIGKAVEDDAAEIGLLVDFDNTRRRWLIDTGGATIVAASAMTIRQGRAKERQR